MKLTLATVEDLAGCLARVLFRMMQKQAIKQTR